MNRALLYAATSYLIVACVGFASLRGLSRPSFVADGVGYYAPLASVLIDHDLDLRNELVQLNPRFLRAAFMSPEGELGNPFPIGPAVLWLPSAYFVSKLPANRVLDAPLALKPRTRHLGFAPRFARAIQWTNMLTVLLAGSALALVLTRRTIWWIASVSALSMVFATPVLSYVLTDPSYGHAASYSAVALLVAAAWLDRTRRLPLELLGFLWGLVALMRSQDAVLGVLLAPRLLDEWSARAPKQRLALVLRFMLPATIAFGPQMLFWLRIYGKPLLIPPGPDLLPLWKPHVVHLLFSTWHGAFVWSPILALGLVGIFFEPDRRLRIAAYVGVVLYLYSASILLDWWGGGAFGPRRLVSIVPIATLGLGLLLTRLRQSRLWLTVVVALLPLLCVSSARVAEYKMQGLLPLNPGDARQYARPRLQITARTRYGHWDYWRLVSEAIRCEGVLRQSQRGP